MDITELKAIIDANIFENTSQAITGDALNDVLNLIADSLGEYVPVADIFDEAGTIRSSLLPSYVDDVLEFSTRDAFPAVGEGGKIYLAADTNLSYRWGGSEYVIIAQSLALGETSSTAYRGDRGKIAYDHSQTSHRLSIAGLEVSALGGSIDTDALASALSIPELRNAVAVHIGDGSIHITADERTAWNKFASLFGIDEEGDIYIKSDENGRARGLYSYSFVSSAGKSDTPGTGGGTVVGATVGGVDVELIDGVLKFDAYPTAASLGLGNIAFKDSLTIADVANLQSALDGKQAVISDLATIRNNASNGATAYSWGNHANAGYALASDLTAHIGNSTIHITAEERTAWNNKYDKPTSGIPYADLADGVKLALDKAHEHANKTSVLDKLKWNEDKNAIYIGDENNRINFFVYGGVASGGFSDAGGVGGGTVTGIKIGSGDIITPVNGILNIPDYPTTTSLGLKNLAFKDSLSVSEVVGLQSALSNKQDAATAINKSNIGDQSVNYATNAGNADLLDGQNLITEVSDWNTDSLSIFKSSEDSTSNAPIDDFIYGITLRFHRDISTYYTDLVTSLYYDRLFFRRKTEGGYRTWRELIHSGNIGSQSVSYATSAGSAPASDVYAWAKKSSLELVDVPDLSSKYLSVNGGTIRGTGDKAYVQLHINGESIPNIEFEVGSISKGVIGWAQNEGMRFKNAATGAGLGIKDNGTPYFNDNLLIHSGNIGSYNAGSATKLQTARTIWGQSFDGTGNVSGALTGVTDITASGNATIAGNVLIGTTSDYGGKLQVNGYLRFVEHGVHLAANGTNGNWANTAIISSGWEGSIEDFTEINVSSYDGNTASIRLIKNGNVGIGTTSPSAKLHVAGNILATGAITAGQASDARLKSNIVTARNACGILRGLHGVEFDWNSVATENCKDLTGHDVGLIAQEVESLIPSAIGTIWGEYKRLDYTKITPYLVEGWKAHDVEIQRLKTKIKQLEERIYELER